MDISSRKNIYPITQDIAGRLSRSPRSDGWSVRVNPNAFSIRRSTTSSDPLPLGRLTGLPNPRPLPETGRGARTRSRFVALYSLYEVRAHSTKGSGLQKDNASNKRFTATRSLLVEAPPSHFGKGDGGLVLVKKQLRFFGPVLNIVTPNLFFNEDLGTRSGRFHGGTEVCVPFWGVSKLRRYSDAY
jgi:hypothetical protein